MKKNQNGNVLILVACLILIVAGVVGAAYFINEKNKDTSLTETVKENLPEGSDKKASVEFVGGNDASGDYWILTLYPDGSGTYVKSPPANDTSANRTEKSYAEGTFNLERLNQYLSTVDLGNYSPDCNNKDSYSARYSDKTLVDMECYFSKNKDTVQLSLQVDYIFEKAQIK